MNIPKTPAEFEYDLWTTVDGKYMVRIKATGETIEVDHIVMRLLRAEEKRLRRAIKSDSGSLSNMTVLSIDYLPEESQASNWLADTSNYSEDVLTNILEQALCDNLTPTQYAVYNSCILGGMSYKEYADQIGVSYQSIQNTIRLIQKKAKIIFRP